MIKHQNIKPKTDCLKHKNLNSFFSDRVNEKELQVIISNTAKNKAAEPSSPNVSIERI